MKKIIQFDTNNRKYNWKFRNKPEINYNLSIIKSVRYDYLSLKNKEIKSKQLIDFK